MNELDRFLSDDVYWVDGSTISAAKLYAAFVARLETRDEWTYERFLDATSHLPRGQFAGELTFANASYRRWRIPDAVRPRLLVRRGILTPETR